MAMRRGVSSSLFKFKLANSNQFLLYLFAFIYLCDLIRLSLKGMSRLPETTDELFIANVAIAIYIIMAHQCLQLDLLGEDSIIRASSKLQIKNLKIYKIDQSCILLSHKRLGGREHIRETESSN